MLEELFTVVVGEMSTILLLLLGRLFLGGWEFIVSREGLIVGQEGSGGARVRLGVRGDLRLPGAADAAGGRLARRGFFRPVMAIVDGENSGAVEQ